MDDDPAAEKSTRDPTAEDVARIARSLNEHGVDYAIIGGVAMQILGRARATSDLDLLVDPAEANIERLRAALSILEDAAVLQVEPDDVARYTVVRVADEVLVDLLGSACGVTLKDVADDIHAFEYQGVAIRYLGPRSMIATKETVRDKDAADRAWLQALMEDARDDEP